MMNIFQIIDYVLIIILAMFFSIKLIKEIQCKKRGSFIAIFSIISIYFLIKTFFVICIIFDL